MSPAATSPALQLLKTIGDPGTCKGCSAEIFWVRHKNGKVAPYTREGLNHFPDCSAAKQFEREPP